MTMQIRPTTQTNIPTILKAQGRSIGWLCRQVGIHRTYYWMMENGRRPVSATYLARAADALGVPVSLLAVDATPVDDDEEAA